MKIEHDFTIGKPIDVVWPMFEDVPALAHCLPGATITQDHGDGSFTGNIAIKLGPFSARFEGEATNTLHPELHSGHLDGKGIDKRGGSRTKMALDYQLRAAGVQTHVTVKADLQLSGPVAQFGRVGVIQQTAEMFIGEFADNLNKKLSATPSVHEPPSELSAQGAPQTDGAEAPMKPSAQQAPVQRQGGASSMQSDASMKTDATGSSVNLLSILKALATRQLRRLIGGGKST